MSEQNNAQAEAPVVESAAPVEQNAEASLETLEAMENDPNVSKEQKQEIKEMKKKFKLKVDGQEFEEEFDPSNEEEIIKMMQLAKVSQKRMNESAGLRKELGMTQSQMNEFLQYLKSDPVGVLSDPNLGVDLTQLAEKIINDEIERRQKSPEQLEIEKLRAELESRNKTEAELKKQRDEEEARKLEETLTASLEKEINEAIEAGDLIKSPLAFKSMVQMMKTANSYGIALSPKELAPIVKEQLYADMKQYMGALNDDALVDLIGKDKISSARKKILSDAQPKKAPITASQISNSAAPARKEEAKKHISSDDFFRNLGRVK